MAPFVSRNHYNGGYRGNFETYGLDLNFQVEPHHFVDGAIEFKCRAQVMGIYSADGVHAAHESRTIKPALLEDHISGK